MTEEQSEKIKYLNKYRDVSKEIARKKRRIENIRESKMNPSIRYDGMPHSNNITDLSDYMVKLEEKETELLNSILEKERLRDEIVEKIERIDSEIEKDVLTYKYIDTLKWNDICSRIGVSWTTAHRIHLNALDNFEI